MKDWTGNTRSAHATIGARNYAREDREVNDYYATDPRAARLLLDVESFSPAIWECACGEGHLAKEFAAAGHFVYASDIVDRGYGVQKDFLKTSAPPS
jgi:2-polyprenyl-3-methyl-5-hydroxy-6-metoxy-1,4-benzoquinol methylase